MGFYQWRQAPLGLTKLAQQSETEYLTTRQYGKGKLYIYSYNKKEEKY